MTNIEVIMKKDQPRLVIRVTPQQKKDLEKRAKIEFPMPVSVQQLVEYLLFPKKEK